MRPDACNVKVPLCESRHFGMSGTQAQAIRPAKRRIPTKSCEPRHTERALAHANMNHF